MSTWQISVLLVPEQILVCRTLYIRFKMLLHRIRGQDEVSRYRDSLRTGRYGGRIPVECEIFRTRPNRPWGPSSLLYNGCRISPGSKEPVRGVDHPPTSSAEVKERVELNLYSPSEPSRPRSGVNFTYIYLYHTGYRPLLT